ncbi:MAG: hypothetical protein ACRCV9_04080 [Burkholderiaceae bacterium]
MHSLQTRQTLDATPLDPWMFKREQTKLNAEGTHFVTAGGKVANIVSITLTAPNGVRTIYEMDAHHALAVAKGVQEAAEFALAPTASPAQGGAA